MGEAGLGRPVLLHGVTAAFLTRHFGRAISVESIRLTREIARPMPLAVTP